MAEKMYRTSLCLALLALCFVLLALLPSVAAQEENNSTGPPRNDQHANSSDESHEEEEKDRCEAREEVMFDSTVRVARFEFHRVQTIFIILVFIMVVVLAKMGKFRATASSSWGGPWQVTGPLVVWKSSYTVLKGTLFLVSSNNLVTTCSCVHVVLALCLYSGHTVPLETQAHAIL